MKTIPYYPEIKIEEFIFESSKELRLGTYLRRKFKGKWRLWFISDKTSFPLSTSNDEYAELKIQFLEMFHNVVYDVLIYGIVNENLELDEIQISEKKRLTNKFRI
jgi:hypothetical protein